MRRYYDAKKQATKRTTDPDSPDDMAFVRDKFVALDPEKCDLCYMLCRSLKARRVVEFGTSFGVSTIYLAAAVRDTVRDHGGEGVVIGTEIEPTKARVANANLADAGLDKFVEVRVGDARQTLKDVGGPVDFLLLDSWIPLVRPVIDVVAPQLRPGRDGRLRQRPDVREGVCRLYGVRAQSEERLPVGAAVARRRPGDLDQAGLIPEARWPARR